MQRQRGLTLLELLVVLAIIGLTLAGVALSLRDSNQTQLDLEAQRLVAHLETARMTSRTSGTTLLWRATPDGYLIAQPPGKPLRTERWLFNTTVATASASPLVLGPEPIITQATITLSQANASATSSHIVRIGTDGLRPFEVLP